MTSLAEIIMNGVDTSWLDDMACVDREISDYFVNAGHTIDPAVLSLCRGCPVREECLRHAYRQDPPLSGSGYFGGMSPGQRKKMNLEEALAWIAEDTAAFRAEQEILAGRHAAA